METRQDNVIYLDMKKQRRTSCSDSAISFASSGHPLAQYIQDIFELGEINEFERDWLLSQVEPLAEKIDALNEKFDPETIARVLADLRKEEAVLESHELLEEQRRQERPQEDPVYATGISAIESITSRELKIWEDSVDWPTLEQNFWGANRLSYYEKLLASKYPADLSIVRPLFTTPQSNFDRIQPETTQTMSEEILNTWYHLVLIFRMCRYEVAHQLKQQTETKKTTESNTKKTNVFHRLFSKFHKD